MKYTLVSLLCLSLLTTEAQRFHGDVYAGVANYQGDLQGSRFTFNQVGFSGGAGVSYDLSNKFILRSALTFSRIQGDDKENTAGKGVAQRNLNFKSNILELQLALEYNLFNLNERNFTPYAFAGGAVFHFNPFTTDLNNNKVHLRPLSTEGQGLAEYPEKEQYKLTQFAVPFGGGVKLVLSPTIQLGLEIGLRKLFTDYVDDVSTSYADSTILLAARGPQAVALAYRGDELPGASSIYPEAGAQRGNPESKDWYYTTNLRLRFAIGGNGGGGRRGTGCPSNVF